MPRAGIQTGFPCILSHNGMYRHFFKMSSLRKKMKRCGKLSSLGDLEILTGDPLSYIKSDLSAAIGHNTRG